MSDPEDKEDIDKIKEYPELFSFLTDQKNIISEFYTNKKWDKFKKQSNQFELVFTTGHTFPSLSSYSPISRSFFKHWEILHDFKEELSFLTNPKVRATFLAEGPGGFIEAFVKYRQKTDDLFGITLISQDRCVPNWKISKTMQEQSNIKLLHGKDKTGSLYNEENIQEYIKEIGRGQCEYITADGGFDFSNNFNNQEETSIRLINAEVYTAFALQKPGGVFLLKIYDIHLDDTKKIIYNLKSNYDKLYFTKPLTSRPANSEKYILCTGYRGYGLLNKSIRPSLSFLNELNEFNAIFIMKQIISINKSLMSIKCNQSFNETLMVQLKRGIQWLHKYNIPIMKESLIFYKKLVKNNNI